ncbi:MAG: hypothetical protein JNM93_06720 [Bacteriovoracaceae bacterium]|nr:hypothetical protein [Bacteriovoracaceae bacterium]
MQTLVILFTLLTSSSYAIDIGKWHIDGFGTIGYMRADFKNDTIEGAFIDRYDYTTSAPAVLPIYNRDDFLYDSNYGLKISYDLNSQLTIDFQTVANGRSGDMDPRVDYGLIRYRLNDQILIRAGLLRPPTWLISEYRYTSALYPWSRPPLENYSVMIINSMPGASFEYQTSLGEDNYFTSTLFIGGGNFEDEAMAQTIKGSTQETTGLVFTFNTDALELRTSFFYSEIDVNVYFLNKKIAVAMDTAAIPNVITTIKSQNAHFISTGLKFDKYNWLVMIEHILLTTKDADLKRVESYYTTLGYYFYNRKFLLHTTYAQTLDRESDSLSPAGDPTDGRRRSLSYGVNYSFNDNWVAKLEVQQFKNDQIDGVSGQQLDYQRFYSASLNFVF